MTYVSCPVCDGKLHIFDDVELICYCCKQWNFTIPNSIEQIFSEIIDSVGYKIEVNHMTNIVTFYKLSIVDYDYNKLKIAHAALIRVDYKNIFKFCESNLAI